MGFHRYIYIYVIPFGEKRFIYGYRHAEKEPFFRISRLDACVDADRISIHLLIYLTMCLSIYLFIYLFIYLSIYQSIYRSIENLKNEYGYIYIYIHVSGNATQSNCTCTNVNIVAWNHAFLCLTLDMIPRYVMSYSGSHSSWRSIVVSSSI